ncbi:MAG: hypothetical protein KGH77_03300 [Candidatus Micrarchaeota archaeon]|nr:hypothetical protein [Candidatus Micrarchaeota archaeon]MDE1864427.1 hypothetical protein [Candidatus Micrarchaeota archaeon]
MQKTDHTQPSKSENQKLKELKHKDPLFHSLCTAQARCGFLIELKLAQSYFSSDQFFGKSLLSVFTSITFPEKRSAVYRFGAWISSEQERKVNSEWRDFFLVGKHTGNKQIEVVARLGTGYKRSSINPHPFSHKSIILTRNGNSSSFQPANHLEVTRRFGSEDSHSKLDILEAYNTSFGSKFKLGERYFGAKVSASKDPHALCEVEIKDVSLTELGYAVGNMLDAELKKNRRL